jgi:hypothetical protein
MRPRTADGHNPRRCERSEAIQCAVWIASAVNSYPAKAGEFSHGTYHPFAVQMGLGARRSAPRNDGGRLRFRRCEDGTKKHKERKFENA